LGPKIDPGKKHFLTLSFFEGLAGALLAKGTAAAGGLQFLDRLPCYRQDIMCPTVAWDAWPQVRQDGG
jgi:hypothetical protein